MKRRPMFPFVRQMEATDCGAACLAMVLSFYGKPVSLDEVRQVTGGGRDGLDMRLLLQAARWFGLKGQGVAFDLEHLPHLEPGAILHWHFNHFVVFERLRRGGVQVVDPAWGRRVVPMSEFRKGFTGVALLLEPGESFQPAPARSRSAWRHVRKALSYPGLLAQVAVSSVFIQLFALALPLLTGALVDRVLPGRDYGLLNVLGAGLAVMVLFHFLASLVRGHLLLYLRSFLDRRMMLQFIDHLVRLPYSFFLARSSGDLLGRINSHGTIREMLTSAALSALLDGGLVCFYLIAILVVSPVLGMVTLVLGLLQVVIFWLSRQRSRELASRGLEAQARSQGYLVQLLTGLQTLKAGGSEQQAVEVWADLFTDETNTVLHRGRLTTTVDALMTALRMGSPLAILFAGGWLVLQNRLTLGTMLSLQALAAGFMVPLATLLTTAMQLQQVGSHLDRINDVLDKSPEQDPAAVAPAGRLKGEVRLEHVSFQYGPLAQPAVRDVSVTIRPGQFVAIVGRSGSGKSTLSGLLAGLHAPTAGRVLYDGLDLAALDLQSVRSQMGIVPQHPYLFGTTVRGNIALADPSVSPEQVTRAARLAQIHEEIAAMPMGYETMLAEGGASLSGGQRQRLALARALVREPVILLLDEATSALDTVTESRVQEGLASLPCTRIVIAQRLSTVMQADQILVMDQGSIVEAGTHADLMAKGGKYAALVAAQVM